MPDNVAVVEGEKLTIKCTVFGTDPEIAWAIGMSLGVLVIWGASE